jgi:hypothetical protein
MTKCDKCKDKEGNNHYESTGKNRPPVGTLAKDPQNGEGRASHHNDCESENVSVH